MKSVIERSPLKGRRGQIWHLLAKSGLNVAMVRGARAKMEHVKKDVKGHYGILARIVTYDFAESNPVS